MNFADPAWFLLLPLIPVAAWFQGKRGERAAFLYSSVQLVKGIRGVSRSYAGRILPRLRWLALCLLIFGLARPQIGRGETRILASGVDIVIAIDLSGSMAAEDFHMGDERVNRVAIAKEVIRKFVARRPSDRIGLVAFAGHAYVAAPLTLDHDYLLENLDRLDVGLIEDGTAIGAALSAALNRLRDVPGKSKLVVLMTDGQNNAGKITPITAAEAAASLKIKVYTIGVGTRGTAPMPQIDVFGQKIYRPMKVDIDEDVLKQIAQKTNARYYRADSTEALRQIYSDIDQLEKTKVLMRKFQDYEELFPWFVLPGLVALLLEIILSNTVWRRLP